MQQHLVYANASLNVSFNTFKEKNNKNSFPNYQDDV